MSASTPYLSIAIDAEVDGKGRLITADPHLMRMHKRNGGVEGGILAIPPIFALAQLAWRTSARIERSVVVADGDTDLELWVSFVHKQDRVRISIFGWQELPARRRSSGLILDRPGLVEIGDEDASLLLDAKSVIIRIETSLVDLIGLKAIGTPIDRIFERTVGGSVADAIAEDENALDVRLQRKDTRYTLDCKKIVSNDGQTLGYRCNLQEIVQSESAHFPAIPQQDRNLGFGRQFASAVRQPLNRIIANAETIGGHVNGPVKENYVGYAHDIATAARHLSELISDLEDLDAIDRADFHVASEKVELGDIARRVGGLLALKAADHQIIMNLPPKEQIVEVSGEFRRVLQIVLNLAGNAIRYSPDGSTIDIAISADPPSLSISDQGRGISLEDRERVFEKFERLGRSGDGGSGLGLYISRRLARAMKGDLSIGENAEGGAIFTLSLPPYRLDQRFSTGM
ncbi:MAG: sensor histidine kinase [Sphingorhabdus sp.]